MTNHSGQRHHKILGSRSNDSSAYKSVVRHARQHSEGGYTLVALMAVMTIFALFAMAAAPRIEQQSQREREKEAIFRGEQVAAAIRDYYRYRQGANRVQADQALPSSMDQLLQGLPVLGGSKSLQILRASAARDPLSLEGEWRVIHPRSQALIDFQESVMLYAGSIIPQPKDPQMVQLQQFAVPPMVNLLNTGSTSRSSGSSSVDEDSSGPFVGVASRSKRSSVLTFYGIERHNEWIFTPLFRN